MNQGIFKFAIMSGLLIVGTFTISCDEYNTLVKKELASGIKNDTLILDLRFGMTKREFFGHCWELNKKGIINEGLNNTSVHFPMEQFGKKYDVDFYPDFHEGKIVSLPVEYTYQAFAPWNSDYSLDVLLNEILILYKQEYGDDFLKIESDDRGVAYVKVDGNRRISIFGNLNKNSVTVLYLDLSVKK